MLAAYLENLIASKPYLSSLKALKLFTYKHITKQLLLIHANSVTNGFSANLQLNNRLIDLYSKQGDLVYARKLFDRIPQRDVGSWTAMITGFSKCGDHLNALLMFKQMHLESARANRFTYGSVLKSCKDLVCLREGMQIHCFIEKRKFVKNLVVKSLLLSLYAKCGKMEDANRLFELMEEKDLVCWNIMINGHITSTAFGLFKLMLSEGKKPDCITLRSLLRVNSLETVSELHGLAIKLGFKELIGSLIDAYVKCNSLTNARKLHEGDLISCTALITCLTQDSNEAFDMFKEMILMKTPIDEVLVTSMVKICTNVASVAIGRQIHGFTLKSTQVIFDVALGNSMIDMYAKCGEIEDAVLVFEEMEERDVRSWTCLIAGYGKHGSIEKAIDLYEKMEKEGIKPNDVTFLSLLTACGHTGETKLGWKIFKTMINKYGIEPREEHLSCIVDMLARGGYLEEAYEVIRSKEGTVRFSASTWGAFLDACRRHGNVQLGEVAAAKLLSMEPKKTVNYINLSSVYADSGAWDNALKTRTLMKEIGSCNKTPGYSLVY